MIKVNAVDIFDAEILIGDICVVPIFDNNLSSLEFGFIKILGDIKYVHGPICVIDCLRKIFDPTSNRYIYRKYSNFGHECVMINDGLIKITDIIKVKQPLFAMNNDEIIDIIGAEYEE